MIEIKTDAGFIKVLVYPKDEGTLDGPVIETYVIDDPQLPWFQSLRAASGQIAVFRIEGRDGRYRVHLDEVAKLESGRMSCFALRLTEEPQENS